MKVLPWFIVSLLAILAAYPPQGTNQIKLKKGETIMEIRSSAFNEGAFIPSKYTCDNLNISPPLEWSHFPSETKTFAIICDDPDAPMWTCVHWLLFNIPGNVVNLPENVPGAEILENGARHGRNDFGKNGYGGPCPPRGTHRYYFRIYALDSELEQGPGITKKELLKAMKDHILASGEFMGRYQRH
jgi:Raf kinase inhibitor-like YbhB/YbcL family protein